MALAIRPNQINVIVVWTHLILFFKMGGVYVISALFICPCSLPLLHSLKLLLMNKKGIITLIMYSHFPFFLLARSFYCSKNPSNNIWNWSCLICKPWINLLHEKYVVSDSTHMHVHSLFLCFTLLLAYIIIYNAMLTTLTVTQTRICRQCLRRSSQLTRSSSLGQHQLQ